MRRFVVLFAVLSLLSACATTKPSMGNLPQADADYMVSADELRKQYPDIEKYDGPGSLGLFGTIYDMPEMTGVNEQLGEPDKKRLSLWNLSGPVVFAAFGLPPVWVAAGGAFVIALHPTVVYEWEKPNYQIEAVVDKPFAFGYDPHLVYWRWYYDDSSNKENMVELSKQE